MGMSFIGSYSGIDQNTIDQLMEAERMPLKQLENKKLGITEKKDAWKDVNTRLNSLFERMKDLEKSSSFNTKIAKSSDDNYVTMSAGNSAAEGKYDIHVKQLATNSSIVGAKIKGVLTDDGKQAELKIKGSFKITNSDKDAISAEIKIEEKDTLRDIVGKINNTTKDSGKVKGTGISATIVDNRIVLKDENTGKREIKIEGLAYPKGEENPGALFDLNKIGLGEGIAAGEGKIEAAEKKSGQSAIFTLNGIKITRDSNRIADAMDGIVINLNRAHPEGSTDIDRVSITSDTEKAAKAMQDFVDQYNSTMKFIEEKTAGGDPKVPGSKGPLAGESSLIRLQSTLRRLVTDEVKDSDIKVASKIGVSTFDKSGALVFDKEKFLTELNKDKDSVMKFLSPGQGKEGLVDRVNREINGFISKSDGVIKDKNESYERSLKDLASRIENFEDRMVKKEAYYVKTFTALDVAMMKAEDQMGWLIGQVDAMNGGGRR